MSDGFEEFGAGSVWSDGAAYGRWYSRFNGYGSISIGADGGNVLALSPKASTSAGETHAALVTSGTAFTSVDFSLRMKTASQLRAGTPNAWETGWVLWDYTDNTHFYYAVLKPNGIEIGKADPAYPGAQRFLVTLPSPALQFGRWYTVRVAQEGNSFNVWVDGALAATYTDNERPYASGAIGLYTEDALVHFDDVVVAR